MNQDTYEKAKEIQTRIKYHTKLKEAVEKEGNSIGVLSKPNQFFNLEEKPFDQDFFNTIKLSLVVNCNAEIEKAQAEFDALQEAQMKVVE